jgi:hypothetical protein
MQDWLDASEETRFRLNPRRVSEYEFAWFHMPHRVRKEGGDEIATLVDVLVF